MACTDYLIKFNQPIYCGVYPDTLNQNVCFYKPIQCPKLTEPKLGRLIQRDNSVFNITEYHCQASYKLEGNAIRHCGYDGKWNGTAPTCVPHNNHGIIVGPIIGVLILCMLIVVSVLCAYHWNKIHDYIRCFDFLPAKPTGKPTAEHSVPNLQ